MAPGEELESDQYLITIEEKLQPSHDHTHEPDSNLQEKRGDLTRGLSQPGKRKRQVLNSMSCTCTYMYMYTSCSIYPHDSKNKQYTVLSGCKNVNRAHIPLLSKSYKPSGP